MLNSYRFLGRCLLSVLCLLSECAECVVSAGLFGPCSALCCGLVLCAVLSAVECCVCKCRVLSAV